MVHLRYTFIQETFLSPDVLIFPPKNSSQRRPSWMCKWDLNHGYLKFCVIWPVFSSTHPHCPLPDLGSFVPDTLNLEDIFSNINLLNAITACVVCSFTDFQSFRFYRPRRWSTGSTTMWVLSFPTGKLLPTLDLLSAVLEMWFGKLSAKDEKRLGMRLVDFH